MLLLGHGRACVRVGRVGRRGVRDGRSVQCLERTCVHDAPGTVGRGLFELSALSPPEQVLLNPKSSVTTTIVSESDRRHQRAQAPASETISRPLQR